MDKSEKYHPSLFGAKQVEVEDKEDEPVIPQNTLYETPITTHQTPLKRHITIFGFSHHNREHILGLVKKCAKIYRKEEGKNWISIWSEDAASLDKILKYNHKVINGEYIGVFRKNFGAVNDSEIYVKKKGILTKVYEYLFGE